MSGVWMFFRTELRRHWRGWLALALLAGVFGGMVMAVAAGARRTDSAYPRLLAWSDASTVDMFFANGGPAAFGHVGGAALATLPQVRSVVRKAGWTVLSPAVAELVASETSGAPSRNKILAGLADPRRADQAEASFALARALHLAVGQRLRIVLLSNAGAPVPVWFRIAGIEAAPGEFPTEQFGTGSDLLWATPAFFRQHRTGLQGFSSVSLWLRHGSADVPAVEREASRLAGGAPLGFSTQRSQSADTERSFHQQAVVLWLLAGLLGLIGVLIAGQLLARLSLLESDGFGALRGVGMGRGQLLAIGLSRAAAIGAVAAVAAVMLAIGLSPAFPVGLAAAAEPHPGLDADWVVLGLGLACVIAATVGSGAWPAWHAVSGAAAAGGWHVPDGRGRKDRPAISALITTMRPVPAATGARLALRRGAGRTALPVPSTIAAAAVGVAALSAAMVFSASLGHLLATPRLYGVTWDASVQDIESNFGPGVQRTVPAVARDPQVATWAATGLGAPLLIHGIEADAEEVSPGHGQSLQPVLITGRLPRDPREIALGPLTLAAVHARLGGTVRVSLTGSRPATVRVVGVAVFPPYSTALGLGHGAAITPAGLRRLLPRGFHAPPPGTLLVRFRPGASQQARIAALTVRLDRLGPYAVLGPASPADLVNFGDVQELPLLVGVCLAALAMLTLVHLLSTSVRRRGRDLAILRTIGFTRGQVRATVAWQAAILTVVALLIGIPAGVACGRLAWLIFTRQLGIVPVIDVPLPALAVLVAAAVALAVAAAVPVGETAARSRPARVLRSE